MEYKGNKITKKAWSWLGVNESKIVIDEDKFKNKEINEKNNNKFNISKDVDKAFLNISYGISHDIVGLNNKYLDKYIYLDGESFNNEEVLNILKKDEAIEIHPISRSGANRFKIKDLDNLKIDIELKENINTTYIIELEKVFNLVTRIKLDKNSKLELIILDREKKNLKDDRAKLESISVVADESSLVNIVKIDFNEYDKYFNYTSDLIGKNSTANITLAYVLNNKEKYDMSFHQRHIAEESMGDIVIEGILKDESSKIFKGTLDFKKGSKGSVGNETEGITNYSKKTKAISLPILLAAEDEIKGNHAANHGEFDKEQIYYITSRGFSEEEAKNIIAESKIVPIIDKVKSKELKEELKKILKEKLED